MSSFIVTRILPTLPWDFAVWISIYVDPGSAMSLWQKLIAKLPLHPSQLQPCSVPVTTALFLRNASSYSGSILYHVSQSWLPLILSSRIEHFCVQSPHFVQPLQLQPYWSVSSLAQVKVLSCSSWIEEWINENKHRVLFLASLNKTNKQMNQTNKQANK